MIDVKKAVELAVECCEEFEIEDIRFEAVELARGEGKPQWLVTVSFPEPGSFDLFGLFRKTFRNYRVVRIDAESGTMESIKIREV
jgi:hypothetical protein